MGDEGLAFSLIFILPAKYEFLPDSTASFIAFAIKIGFVDSAIAVFIRTPSQPSSIAKQASDGQPMPASIIIALFGVEMFIDRIL